MIAAPGSIWVRQVDAAPPDRTLTPARSAAESPGVGALYGLSVLATRSGQVTSRSTCSATEPNHHLEGPLRP